MVTEVNAEKNGKKTIACLVNSSEKKKFERKHGKAEKSINLEVLQLYFSGSLKSAAKALGCMLLSFLFRLFHILGSGNQPENFISFLLQFVLQP